MDVTNPRIVRSAIDTDSRTCMRCGTRLARDNSASFCAACGRAGRGLPQLPAAAWRSGEIRNALRDRDIGAVLRAWRRHEAHGSRPVPQTALAHELGITQGQLSRIENGRHRVRDLDKLTHYARTLGVPTELLWFEPDDPAPPLQVVEPLQLRNGAEIATVASASEPGLADSLLATLDEYVLADRLAGSRALLPIVTQQAKFIEHLQHTGHAGTRAELRGVRARFDEFLGWLHQDAGNLPDAIRWTARAGRLAQRSRNYQLLSYIRARQSSLAADADEGYTTVDLARSALRVPAELTHRQRAMALCQLAHGHARIGNTDDCLRALDQAAQHAVHPDADRGDLAHHCTTDYVAMEAADCLIELDRPAQAIEVLEPRLPHWPPEDRRDLGRSLALLAVALARTDDPDRALDVAEHALAITAEIRSARIERQLYRLIRQLHLVGGPEQAAELRTAVQKAL